MVFFGVLSYKGKGAVMASGRFNGQSASNIYFARIHAHKV